ncbi:BglG family transcription antiterminator [Oceanobacillus neutriphilus]|uniref:Transcriptional antiterminator n=1 Tax=Oceanobacillus neutriphilus TaxID=531815 RepID=A0ABQ2NTE6_9BACI|nr:BglG family transcription antiterminator [Oceanobacillus neutriphilus]GGP10220.1 transcriptional antiterminator [Oceanobacillus neutriphilus]
MNKRQTKLVQYLISQDDWVKGNQLAVDFNVSSRTIRNDIQTLQLNGFKISSSKTYGYRIEESSEAVRHLDKKNEFPETAYDRMVYILKRLLHVSEQQNIFDLADELFVSESTIEKDLYRLKDFITNTESKVKLERIENGILLEGSTRAKRTLWSKLIFNEIKEDLFDIYELENHFNEINLKDIRHILSEVLSEYKIFLNDLSMINMVIHVAIILDTIIRKEQTIPSSEVDYTSSEEELAASEKICEKLGDLYGITIPLPEIKYIAILIGGKKSYYNDTLKEHKRKIDSRFSELAKELIQSISNKFLIDLSEDEKLHIDLSMHLKSLYNRNQRGVEIHNPVLMETQRKFPLIYDMGIFMGLEYELKTNQKLNEDEIGLLTLHLCIAFERLAKERQTNNRIAILCPTGFTTSRLLKAKLENIYGDKIGQLQLFSLSDSWDAIAQFNPDLVLTTARVPEGFPFPTLEVTPFLSEKEIEKIDAYLQPKEKKFNNQNVVSYFSEDLFFPDITKQTPDEVIAFLSSELERQGIVPPKYNELILAREAISSTAYGNLIALPHPIEKVASKTIIAVCTLSQPVQWGNQKVQLVLLFALANDKRELMDSLFREIIDMLDNPKKVKKILQAKDFGSFAELIR